MFFNLDRNSKQNLFNQYKQDAIDYRQKKNIEKQRRIQEEREYLAKRELIEKEADETEETFQKAANLNRQDKKLLVTQLARELGLQVSEASNDDDWDDDDGEVFDPKQEEAIVSDHVEDKEDEVVLEVLQKGYKLKDRVIRPAKVKINQK